MSDEHQTNGTLTEAGPSLVANEADQPNPPNPPETVKDYSDQLRSKEPARDTDQIVEQWFDNHIRGSIVGQNTSIWNHIMVCKDKLKEALRL